MTEKKSKVVTPLNVLPIFTVTYPAEYQDNEIDKYFELIAHKLGYTSSGGNHSFENGQRSLTFNKI